ncbi:P-loop containing nucleoside triphosphate hydrolase protein [Saccharata proteae CBS 121410]|uniref:P-loop containing nucleoside triphosphate hydrolase protein n=1 Tax=Saccharata proteae CBS 121410 TaxID=1314787 RepID=A0A9P4LXS3_9PEZI|nr:P-loop containing nucleoside triphosphate hydrolase protein [Saccharata proteae CBS 121410]
MTDKGRGPGHGHGHGQGQKPCFHFSKTGRCRFGARCKFSHDAAAVINRSTPSARTHSRKEQTPEQTSARDEYQDWKNQIRRAPSSNDLATMRQVWEGALNILDGTDHHSKQRLPHDLDDDALRGLEHIEALMSLEPRGQGNDEFIALVRPFLSVITHDALLDCLSVDTAVGGLYRLIGDDSGARAITFFRHFQASLVEQHLASGPSQSSVQVGSDIMSLLTSLRQLVVREPRVSFHDELPDLINAIENTVTAVGIPEDSTTSVVLRNKILELRGIVGQARGLLRPVQVTGPTGNGARGVTSTAYPRDLILPDGRYDNDNLDIAKIGILPTVAEIRGEFQEFLPSTALDQPHFLTDGMSRHLDTHFRLLRQDIFGELKDSLCGLMGAVEKDPTLLGKESTRLRNIRAHCYPNTRVDSISFDKMRGLEAQLTFPQPRKLLQKSEQERRLWWEASKRLDEGILLCFLFLDGHESSLLLFKSSKNNTNPKDEYTLISGKEVTAVTKLATTDSDNLNSLVRLSAQRTHGILIELPGILLATFVPILENIQRMQHHHRLPFLNWIVPNYSATREDNSTPKIIPPPLYAQSTGFTFSMDPILTRPSEHFSLPPTTGTDDPAVLQKLANGTGLDEGQCKALIAALTREYALIQGPPGTGKSYLGVQLMRVLLEAKSRAKLGPIIVVCYTNHALDQFLENLIEVGIQNVIRIGGQSQSKTLQEKNLRLMSRNEAKTGPEKYQLFKNYERRENLERTFKSCLRALEVASQTRSSNHIEEYLSWNHPEISRQFDQFDEEGFQLAGGPKSRFNLWKEGGASALALPGSRPSEMSDERLVDIASKDIHSLSSAQDRLRLMEIWNKEIRAEKADVLSDSIKEYNETSSEIGKIHDEGDRRVLQTADVIGVTTTGLAKRIEVLQKVHSKVVICEEAAEVLESHLISALLPSVEHVIQIGDHQQLRPQINSFDLSLESRQGRLYKLDRSQFERLAVGEDGQPPFPLAQLNVQRRMRPEISNLIRQTMYPNLIDYSTVETLPNVVGMRQNVFWLDHKYYEEEGDKEHQQTSHSNLWEVSMVQGLVRHIVRQGVYSSDDIAVLTPYTGQLRKLREKLGEEFEVVLSERDEKELIQAGFDEDDDQAQTYLAKKKLSEMLRVATVDNFQGEEAKVVIVSLVRSNPEQKVGFLKTSNRINVLLSRAKHGMYLLGDADTYSNVAMWSQVISMLRGMDAVGTELGLCCPRHLETRLGVSQPEDFARLSPQGGCQLSCDRRLPACGHRCRATCHSESMHEVFACPEPCARLHSPCNHPCQKATCGEDCGHCMIPIDNVKLPCGHTKNKVACYLTQDTAKIHCAVKIKKKGPKCEHLVDVACSVNMQLEGYRCPVACDGLLKCGHQCPGTCAQCRHWTMFDDKPVFIHRFCGKGCDGKEDVQVLQGHFDDLDI